EQKKQTGHASDGQRPSAAEESVAQQAESQQDAVQAVRQAVDAEVEEAALPVESRARAQQQPQAEIGGLPSSRPAKQDRDQHALEGREVYEVRQKSHEPGRPQKQKANAGLHVQQAAVGDRKTQPLF